MSDIACGCYQELWNRGNGFGVSTLRIVVRATRKPLEQSFSIVEGERLDICYVDVGECPSPSERGFKQ